MSAPTTQIIASRMERTAPSERRAVLRQCARDVAELWRMKRLNHRQRNEWVNALQNWGQNRGGLTWSQATTEIIRGLREVDR
jgi:hypothetical protein